MRKGTQPLPFEYRRSDGCLRLGAVEGGGPPVVVVFSGAVKEGALIGLYRCRHADSSVLTSQCAPVGARRIFPCLDQPDRKSRLRLTVRTRADLEVVSNTSPESVRTLEGVREWSFVPTPPMSCYLFYLAIGRFDRAEALGGRVLVRVLGPPGRGSAGEYAAHAGRRILEAYEEYFRIPYPLPKLDLVAVADLAFGAMENWGAISFRDMRLLVDPGADSFTRRDVFETVAHELAHQWFGNLVTMASWDDVWLNESFASLMETRLTERLEPTLDARTDFYLRPAGTAAALDGDSLYSTHPVRAQVGRPEEISQIFDENQLREGLVDPWDARGVPRTGPVPGRRRRLPRTVPVCQRPHRGPLGGARASRARTGRRDGDPVDRPTRPPGHHRPARWRDAAPFPTSLHISPFPQRRASVADPPGDGHRRRAPSVGLLGPRGSGLRPGRRGHPPQPGSGRLLPRPGTDRGLLDCLLEALPSRNATDRWSVLENLGAFLLSGEADWPTYVRFVRGVGATNDLLVVNTLAGDLSALGRILPSVGEVQDEGRRYYADRLDAIGLQRRPDEPAAIGILRERLTG